MCEFKVGDKVIVSKSSKDYKDYRLRNGIVGTVTDVDDFMGNLIISVDSLGANIYWPANHFKLAA